MSGCGSAGPRASRRKTPRVSQGCVGPLAPSACQLTHPRGATGVGFGTYAVLNLNRVEDGPSRYAVSVIVSELEWAPAGASARSGRSTVRAIAIAARSSPAPTR